MSFMISLTSETWGLVMLSIEAMHEQAFNSSLDFHGIKKLMLLARESVQDPAVR